MPAGPAPLNLVPHQGGVGGLMVNPEQRMAQLAGQYGPAFLTGNGETGVGRSDARGYSQMLNDQTEYMNLGAGLQGKAGPDIEFGGTIRPQVSRTFKQATGMYRPLRS